MDGTPLGSADADKFDPTVRQLRNDRDWTFEPVDLHLERDTSAASQNDYTVFAEAFEAAALTAGRIVWIPDEGPPVAFDVDSRALYDRSVSYWAVMLAVGVALIVLTFLLVWPR